MVQKALFLLQQIKDSTGTIKGVVAMDINLDALTTKLIGNIEIGKNGYNCLSR
jgi:hypothetical protein